MVFFAGDLFQLREVHQAGELIEVKHVLALAVFAEESDILTQIHVFEVIRDKTSVAALDTLAEFRQELFRVSHRAK